MRTVFQLIAIASAGLALTACSGERLSGSSSASSAAPNSYAYEPPGSIARAPLSAPPGYGPQPGYESGYGSQPGYGSPQGYGSQQGYGSPQAYASQPGYGSDYGSQQGYGAPPPLGAPSAHGNSQGYGSQGYGAADTAAPAGWRASPRWSAVQGDGCIEVDQGGAGEPGAPGTQVRRCAREAPSYPSGIDDQAGYY